MSLTIDHTLNSIISSNQVLIISNTGAITVPRGTTGERPGSAVTGMTRFNTTTDELEVYKSSGWTTVGGTGGASNADAIAFAIVFGS